MIYFDNAATTIQKPEIVGKAVYNALMSQEFGNPSRGAYPESLNALRELTKTRMALGEYFDLGDPLNVVLSSNISFALNLIIKSLFTSDDHIITSLSEHNSILRPLYAKEKEGCQLSFLDLDEDFNIKIENIEKLINKNTKAVVITGASNVSGKVTDLKRVHEITKEHNLKLIIDGAQIAGCLEFSMKDFDNTIFAFTGHKSLHGPQGTGGFLIKGDFDFRQVVAGGSGFNSFSHEQPHAIPELFEPGTANVHSFAGLRAALKELEKEKPYDKIQELTKLLYRELKKNKNLEFYTHLDKVNAPIVSINIKNADANEVGQRLYDEYGICVRTGSHCAPLFHEKMGTRERGIVRLSLSSYTSEEEIFQAVKAIEEISESYK